MRDNQTEAKVTVTVTHVQASKVPGGWGCCSSTYQRGGTGRIGNWAATRGCLKACQSYLTLVIHGCPPEYYFVLSHPVLRFSITYP